MILNVLAALQRKRVGGGGGGSPAWTYTIAVAALDGSPDTFAVGDDRAQQITLPAGTLSKLSVYSIQSLGGEVKVALYPSDLSAPIISGSVSPPVDFDGLDLEVTVTDTVIAAGTYWIAFTASGSSLQSWGTSTTDSNYKGNFDSVYASFPQTPYGEDFSSSTATYRVGAYITP